MASMIASTSKRTFSLAARCYCFQASSRAVHTRPSLPYDINAGLEPFLSAKAVRGTAVEWHQHSLDKLNDLARGTRYENMDVANTLMVSSKRREDALIFGNASEALNNGFFLASLSSSANQSPHFNTQEAIKNTFGSVTSFINHFSSYASGQFGSGYVWLVMDSVDNLAVLSTYGSGTLLLTDARRPAPVTFVNASDQDTQDISSASQAAQASVGHETQRQPTREYENPASSQPSPQVPGSAPASGQVRSYHTSPVSMSEAARNAGLPPRRPKVLPTKSARSDSYLSSEKKFGEMGTAWPKRVVDERFMSVHPLLCLSLHSHVYIPDYGIAGKTQYIENFWKNVNWELVERRYNDVKAIYTSSSTTKNGPTDFGPDRHSSYSRLSSQPRSEALNPNQSIR